MEARRNWCSSAQRASGNIELYSFHSHAATPRLCNALAENGNLGKVGGYLSSPAFQFRLMRCKAPHPRSGSGIGRGAQKGDLPHRERFRFLALGLVARVNSSPCVRPVVRKFSLASVRCRNRYLHRIRGVRQKGDGTPACQRRNRDLVGFLTVLVRGLTPYSGQSSTVGEVGILLLAFHEQKCFS